MTSELAQAAFLGRTDAPARGGRELAAFARTFSPAEFEASVRRAGFRVVTRSSPAFPPLLAAIHDPPAALFARGDGPLELLHRPAVAIVGARACSSYGEAAAFALGRELAAAGVVVVSGLARGVDAAAHRGALDGGGPTVAVLGCGIDRIYPHAHRSLAEAVSGGGLILSEYPPGVPPAPWRFPARNRIVAGLAAATVVVEARERSGALITADFALEEGREVLAVPGEITSALSRGTNLLIRAGATLVADYGDVLEALGLEPAPPQEPELDPAAAKVLAALADGAAGADALARATELGADAVAVALTRLELEGLVASGGGLFRSTATAGSPDARASPQN